MGEVLENVLLEICNEVLLQAKTPESWKEAYITLIPKEGADANQIKNYSSILLLNLDYKIFMIVMVERLKKVLNDRIHPDQNGFLSTRQIRYNTSTIIDILEYYELHPENQVALVFLDAKKAFDNLNWDFMKQQFYLMNFGRKFSKMLNSIYATQKVRIMINGEITDTFEIKKGVRQGCPLSPLLFIIILETLLDRIRSNKEIKGTKIKNISYKHLLMTWYL
uniref:Reverse transcriptase domain-containing protein n=1 Tax=Micrurus carvalhoi TaxID=3147026 RepID=A0A2H6N8K0_9SAUR